MLQQKNTKLKYRFLGHIAMMVSAVLFCIVKFGGPFWVRTLFEHGKINFLNAFLSVSGEAPSLTLYLGLAEQNIFGPAGQVLAATSLILFSFFYLQRVSLVRFGICIFFFILATKAEVLFFPPYGDAIGGPFAEAWWLAQNNFDYAGLFHQPDFARGGPRVYLFSIYPTYVALWMKILKNPLIFLPVLHLIVFMMIAAVASLLREISRKMLSDKTAVLMSLLFLFLPLVQSQTESLNMEPPCLFFVMLSAYFLIRRKIVPASLAAFGAVWIKGTGIMACGAVAVVAFLWFIDEFRKERRINLRYIFCIFFMLAIPCLKLFSKYFIGDAHVSAGMVGLLNGLPSLKVIVVVRWFAASLFVYLVFLILSFRTKKKGIFDSGIMYLFGTSYFLLLLNFVAASSRYRLSVCPFFVFSIVYSLSLFIKRESWQAVILVIAIGIAAFSSYGFFWGNNLDHVILERSMEYRNDMYLDQEIVKTIEKNYHGFKIGAPIQIAQMLALEELGYVKKDLDVFIYGFSCHYGGIQNFSGLSDLDIRRTVFIGKKSDGNVKLSFIPEYPVDPKDIVLREISYGNKKGWIFMGGVAIEKLYRAIQIIMQG